MISWIARLISSVFTLKFFMSGVMMTIIAIVLYNGVVEIIQEVMNFALTQVNGVAVDGISSPSISGFAGWFLAQVKVPECVAVIVSMISIKFVLRKIPFLKW
jgi:hypothetical protein